VFGRNFGNDGAATGRVSVVAPRGVRMVGQRPGGLENLALCLSAQSIGRGRGVMIVTVAMGGPMSVPMPEKVHGEHTEGEHDPNPIISKPSHHTTPLQGLSQRRAGSGTSVRLP